MTGEQDTGNPERLPLAERARRGLLAGESELWLGEIMQLEFPAFTSYEDRQRPDYSGWGKSVEAAIQYGLLGDSPRRVETVKSETHRFLDTRRAYLSGPRERTIHVVGSSDWRIPREPYRTWRATQPNPPAGSIIHLWLGTIPTPANLPQSEPDKPEQGAASTRQIALGEAEDVALATLRKELKREPDFEEWWHYITERDDTGTISDHTDDRLMWTGKDGRNCETAKSTMRNRLTEARKRNPFNL